MISGRQLGLDVRGSSGGEELVVCPFHDDHKPSAWFNPVKGLFWCAVCQKGLNVEQLAAALGTTVEVEQQQAEPPPFDLMVAPLPPMPTGYTYATYIQQRGIENETMQLYDVRWQQEPAEAAVFPMRSVNGQLRGLVHRYADALKVGTRYRKMGEMMPVWPMEWLATLKERARIVVVEGPWSAMRLNQALAGDSDVRVYASFGAKANRSMLDVLEPFEPVFLYDHDRAGQAACEKMQRMTKRWHAALVSPSPDDMNDGQLKRLIQAVGRLV